MSDDTADATDGGTVDGGPDVPASDDDGSVGATADDPSRMSRLRDVLNYGVLAGLLLLALVSAVGLYTSVSGVISTWVAPEWQPLFRAAFNLVVLLLAGGGIAWQARRVA